MLVVEDSAATRDMLRRTLEREGWSVTEAENGQAALERLAQAQPALILLDLMMPKMDGFKFLTELRSHVRWASIPVIVITAIDLTRENQRMLNNSTVEILQKGAYSNKQLLAHVSKLVSESTGQS